MDWFKDASKHEKGIEVNAMSLSTASKEGRPSNRYVLLKELKDNKFVFFTNYNSRKGKHLEENPFASCLFYWPTLHRSVRIEGSVSKIEESRSTEYFQSRPLTSQISGYISPQSQIISRKEKESMVLELS